MDKSTLNYKSKSEQLFGFSLLNLSIDNLSLGSDTLLVILVIIIFVLVLIVLHQSNTSLGFRLRKLLPIGPRKKESDYRNMAKILFIDDKDIPMAGTLKDDKWNVEKTRDAQIADPKIKNGNIIFVDWKGVGRKINSEDEGIALVENIKNKYGNNKYVILYSAQEYKKPEGTKADDWINKGSEYSVYLEKIKKACFTLFR